MSRNAFKLFRFIAVVIFATLLVSSCAPALQGFVELPQTQKDAIAGIFVALFALLFDLAIGRIPWLEFFRQYQEAWALAAAAVFTAWLENILPSDFGEIAIKLVSLLIAVVLYLLGRTWLMRRGTQGFV